MKIFTRIATAVVAAIASLFVAAPAFASEGEKFNPADQFSTAGQPVEVVPILITGVIILAVVLLLAQLVGNLFEKQPEL